MAQKTKMKSTEYWRKRFLYLEQASNAYGVEAYRKIESVFTSAEREIQKEIEAWFGRYMKNNQVNMIEARRQLTTKELKELRWDVEEYISKGRENALNGGWVKELENASAKFHISRLEALKIRVQNAAEVAFGNELDVIDGLARRVYTENYYESIFEVQRGFNLGWEIGQIDERKLNTLISKPWAADGRQFCERIWQQRSELVNELHQQLTRTCLLGKAPDEAISAISKKFDVTKHQAGRLVMTEQAYFHSVAQQDAFKELDVEEFEIVATLDSHTSPICQEMDGKVFPMSQYEPGVTAPPFHVWCRSVTVPYFDDNFTERAARDEDGNTYYVPGDMTYKEWKKSMVDGDTSGLDLMSSASLGINLSKAKPIQHSPEELSELKAYATQRGINVYNIDDFDGDSEVLKEEIDMLSSLKTEYKYDERITISFEDFDPNDLARTEPNSKTITFNRCALRDRNLTNAYLNADNELSSTDIKGIAAHEMGHKLYEKYGNKGLDIAQKTYYNVFGENPSVDMLRKYLKNNVSKYSISISEELLDRPFKPKYLRELIPEMFGKNTTSPDDFTSEFIKLLKEGWNI
ncbi:MAG: minor capsid protein [Clostridia bacterium]|nr:minor capsid protein [Clostridia bacterium]